MEGGRELHCVSDMIEYFHFGSPYIYRAWRDLLTTLDMATH